MPLTNRRPCTIDTSLHFGPQAGCDYRGWQGLGTLRATGHPRGGPWRQVSCRSCPGAFWETHGPLWHGKRRPVELSVRVLACVAEGLGVRATARGCEVDPKTVWQWWVEVAAPSALGARRRGVGDRVGASSVEKVVRIAYTQVTYRPFCFA